MQIGRVIGNVISTRKTGRIEGLPLLVLQPLDERLKPAGRTVVCTDTVHARQNDLVLICSSSSARMTDKTRDVCTDQTLVAIVEIISSGRQDLYNRSRESEEEVS